MQWNSGKAIVFVFCTFVNVWNIVSHIVFLSYMFFARVTAHLLYELVGMYIGYLEEGPATMHRSSRLPCILYFTYMCGGIFWDVFLFGFFLSFFSSKRFLERFFSHGHAGHMS